MDSKHRGVPGDMGTHGTPGTHDPPPYGTAPDYSSPQDKLPPYKPSLEFYGVCLIKTEFLTPYHSNNGDRTWRPVVLELNSTQLNVYALKGDRKFQDLVVCLYNELNSLDELIHDVNNDYKFPTDTRGTRSRSSSLDDLFSGDAYGGMSLNDVYREQLMLSNSGLGKLRMKHRKHKSQKILNNDLARHYDSLKDNQLLFEPITSSAQYQVFKHKYQGELVNSYTLSHAQIGEAPSLNQLISAMYKEEDFSNSTALNNLSTLVRYKNVLRVRIEYKQLLLQFWSFFGMTHWFRMLTVGRDLSHPLEARSVSKLKSIPSRSSSRNNALLTATMAAAMYGRRNSHTIEDLAVGSSSGLMLNVSNEPIPSGSKISPPNNDCRVSISSSEGSIFDVTSRDSISSDASAIGRFSTTINNYKFFSYENYHTTLEKQYISNCMPDLNSYDKWNGKSMTLSNFASFMERKLHENEDIFIGYTHMYGTVQAFEKANKKQKPVQGGKCRNFLIHSGGLVSVVLK